MKLSPPVVIVSGVCAGFLVIGVVFAFIPRQFGADRHANPITHQCEQSEAVTCGPAACVEADSWQGRDVTEREMVIACKTGPGGTTWANLAAAMHSPVEPMPEHAPGRTFVVYLNDYAPHFICAHDDPVRGWLVNDPWHETGPESWQPGDFGSTWGAIEVR